MNTCKHCGVDETRHGTSCGESNAIQFSSRGRVTINGAEYTPKLELDVAIAERENLHARIRALEEELARQEVRLHREEARIDALEETIRHCPGTELGYNDDETEGEVGFTMEIDGCDPVKHVSATFRSMLDLHIHEVLQRR